MENVVVTDLVPNKDLEKVAVIDLGSNTARLILFEVNENGHFRIIDQMKETPRVGEGMADDGFLKPARIQETIKTLKMFRKLCDVNGVEHIIGVATTAIRKAKNQRSFLEEVSATCGIKLRVLSEEEEALFVYRGVINTMDTPKGIILEIGGGSTKIIYYNRRNLLNCVALPFGSITLTDMFPPEKYSSEEQAKKIEAYFTKQISGIDWLQDIDPENTALIGVGGSFRNICRVSKIMKKYPLTNIHNYVINDVDFEHIYDLLRSLDIDKKKKIKGLSSGRSDILPGAVASIAAFKKFMKLKDIVVSGSGLRTGLMFSYAMPEILEKPVSDVMINSLTEINEFYGADKKHVEQVVMLSIQLFKQLRVLHKFPRQYLKVLKIAAFLHESGKRMGFHNFEKHSGYIILNSEIYGVSHRDLVLASFVVSNTSMEDIDMYNWMKYRDFVTDEDIDVVKKMGIMLRIADSLDRSLSSVVKGINCDILGDSVILKTEVEGNASSASMEINAATSLGSEFRKIFKKNLEVL